MPGEDRLERIEHKVDNNSGKIDNVGQAVRSLSRVMGNMHMEMRETMASLYEAARKDEREALGYPREPRKKRLRLVPVALVVLGLGGLTAWALWGRAPQVQRVAGPTATVTTPGPTVTSILPSPTRPAHKTPGPASQSPRSSATQAPGLSTGQPVDQTSRPAARTPEHDQRTARRYTPGSTPQPTHHKPPPTASAEPPQDPEPSCLVKVNALGLGVCV